MKFLLILTLFITYTLAAPAFNKLREFKQSDGTTFEARAFGNQHLNWIETKEGEILKYNEDSKNFEYAKIKDERLKASGARYEQNNSKRARSLKQVNKISKNELRKLWAKRQSDAHERKKALK